MNNILLLKAQAKLSMTLVDARTAIGINNYISALENLVEAGNKLASNIKPSTDPESRYYDIDPQDLHDYYESMK